MESILARALEYTLKYWLKSFSRDQFKLQGRTAQLSNLGQFSLIHFLISSISLVTSINSGNWGFSCFVFFLNFGRYQWRRSAFQHGVAAGAKCYDGEGWQVGDYGGC